MYVKYANIWQKLLSRYRYFYLFIKYFAKYEGQEKKGILLRHVTHNKQQLQQSVKIRLHQIRFKCGLNQNRLQIALN